MSCRFQVARPKLSHGTSPSFTFQLKPAPFLNALSLRTRPRCQFTQKASPPPQSHSRRLFSPFITLLFFAGVGTTAYGLYEFYNTLVLWPPEVRGDLRSGLRAKHRGDLDGSEQYLQRAWTTAESLPISVFASEPYLKLSGIAICIASVLEQNHKLERAFEMYEDALEKFPRTWEGLTGKEKLRAVTIAYKLGELAGDMKGKEEKEEGYLAWAVEALLKSFQDNNERNTGEGQRVMGRSENDNVDPDMKELQLPEWATKTDVAAPFEALASFYARTGNLQYAMVLYLQAISVLIPPPPQTSSPEDRCRGAQLMTALSDLVMRNTESKSLSETLHQAELWSKKALDIAMQHSSALNSTGVTQNLDCDVALAVATYNIGILKKMMGDRETARSHFEQSLKVSKAIGMQVGIQNAEEALRKMHEGTEQT